MQVPHTWQTTQATADYLGMAWYKRSFFAPAAWKGKTVRVEFEAVYHTAVVTLNGKPLGEHKGKGYTAFEFDITNAIKWNAENEIQVKADNSFFDAMLPRGKSYDWTPDGGIYRPVRLLVTPRVYIDRVEVDAIPDLATGKAQLAIRAIVRGGTKPVTCSILEEQSGRIVASLALKNGEGSVTIDKAKLWHFDHPNLYRVVASTGEHSVESTFGIRKIEVRAMADFISMASASGCTVWSAWRAVIRSTAWRNRRVGSITITPT